MKGLVPEGEEIIGLGLDKDAQDAGLIAAAQTLEEEKRTDEKLPQLAKQNINAKANK